MNRRQPSLEVGIEKLKQEIARRGDLRPGKLSQQDNVCGKADCRCKADPPQKQLRNYQQLRKLVDRWIALGMELSRFKLQSPPERSQTVSPKRQPAHRVGKRR